MVACFVKDGRKRHCLIKTLLNHGADPSLPDALKRNSIMYACALSLREEVKLLVKDCDYDLNTMDLYRDTLLHICAKAGDQQVLEIVLGEMQRYRMDISLQNNFHLTPLSLAILNGNYECARILHEAGGCPRFSKDKFGQVLEVLCDNHVRVSSAGMRAIQDARSVGEAFDAQAYFLKSAEDITLRSSISSRDTAASIGGARSSGRSPSSVDFTWNI